MEQHNRSGSKYLREIRGAVGNKIDVYAVLLAFDVRCPARQHAIKKLLCSGLRGDKDAVQDITEARDACERALQLATIGGVVEKMDSMTVAVDAIEAPVICGGAPAFIADNACGNLCRKSIPGVNA